VNYHSEYFFHQQQKRPTSEVGQNSIEVLLERIFNTEDNYKITPANNQQKARALTTTLATAAAAADRKL